MIRIDAKYGYIVVYEREDDGWWVVHVPELPGCISQGHGLAEASQNILSAMDDYISLLDGDLPIVSEHSVTGASSSAFEETSTGGTWFNAA